MPTIHKRNIIGYVFLFLLTEAILLFYLYQTGKQFFRITPDGQLYFNIAENFVKGNGMINTVRKEDIIVPPLFSIFLVPFAFFHSAKLFILFQYVVYGFNGVLLAFLGEQLFHRFKSGMAAGLLYAVHPVLLLNGPQYLLTETLFITFILLILYSILRFIRDEKKTKWLITSVALLSASLLFRPHLMYVFLLLGLLWLLYWRTKKLRAATILAFLIPVVCLAANGLHNWSLHGKFVVLENYSGQNLYIANNPHTKVAFFATTIVDQFVEPEYFSYSRLSLSEKSELLKEKAVHYMLSYPGETIKRLVLKTGLFFQGIDALDWMTLFISIAGIIWSLWKEKKMRLEILFLILFILGFAVLTSLGLLVGGQRYRVPIIPVYLLFGGYFLSSLLPRQLFRGK